MSKEFIKVRESHDDILHTKEVLYSDYYFVLHTHLVITDTNKLGTINKHRTDEERIVKYIVAMNTANCLCDVTKYDCIAKFSNKKEALRFIKYLHNSGTNLERMRVRERTFIKNEFLELCTNYVRSTKSYFVVGGNYY